MSLENETTNGVDIIDLVDNGLFVKLKIASQATCEKAIATISTRLYSSIRIFFLVKIWEFFFAKLDS